MCLKVLITASLQKMIQERSDSLKASQLCKSVFTNVWSPPEKSKNSSSLISLVDLQPHLLYKVWVLCLILLCFRFPFNIGADLDFLSRLSNLVFWPQQGGFRLLLRQRNVFAVVWQEDKHCFSFSLFSVLLQFIFFFSCFIHYLFQMFSLCLPQILPGKPLPPMMFSWWLVRSGPNLRFLAGIFLLAMYSAVTIWPGQNSWALRRCKGI